MLLRLIGILLISSVSFADELHGLEASVSLSVTKGGTPYICSGALINPYTVVTAAHCLENAEYVSVSNARTAGRARDLRPAISWKIHPGNTGNFPNNIDLGVIKLANEMKAKTYFTPLSFSTINMNSVLLERVGYGGRNMEARLSAQKSASGYPNIRTLISSDVSSFRKNGVYYSFEDEYGFDGDSGGPVFMRMNEKLMLVGVHSGRALDMNGNLLNISNFIPLTASRIQWIQQP